MNNKKYKAVLFIVIVFIVLAISTIVASWTRLIDFYVTKSFIEKEVEIIDSLYEMPSVGMALRKEAKPDFYLVFFLGFEECTACYIGAIEKFVNEMLTYSKCNVEGIIVTDKALSYQDSLAIEKTDILSVVDGEHKLCEKISFVSNERYNTLLLDKNQRIKVIGNPIKNPAVSNLIGKVIGQKKHKAKIMTEATVDKYVFDFGKIRMDSVYSTKCKITNTGANKLIIYDVATSCGCTTVEYDNHPILSGQSSNISINFRPLVKEKFSKRIFIRCNIANSPIILAVRGEAI